jgi:hypothetical protein
MDELELDETKVISMNDIRTFNKSADVFIFDDEHQNVRRCNFEVCKLHCEPVVPVYGESGLIGCATLKVEGKVVVAEFFIDYETPERLDLENGSPGLYPHLQGHYTVKSVSGKADVAQKFMVSSVILNKNRDIDPRIGTI